MNLDEAFLEWQRENKQGWGLAWYLAAEICRRFYASHGIVPHVNEHEGLGYYGILLDYVPCRVNGERPTLGRFSAEGDAEPWEIDPNSVGSHSIALAEKMRTGASPDDLVKEAIAAFRLSPLPEKTHLNCRHKRWGQSYVLMFDLTARIAFQAHPDDIRIWNDPYHTQGLARKYDPNFAQKEHLGHILFDHHGREVLLAGDGRVLVPEGGSSFWERFMAGASEIELFAELMKMLDC